MPEASCQKRHARRRSHNLPVHVGQPEVSSLESVGQFLVVEAEQVQQRGVQVVDVDRIFHRPKAELVGLAIDLPRFEAAAGKPHREGIDVVIAAGVLPHFPHRRAAELATPDHDRVVEQSALFQVTDRARRWGWSIVKAFCGQVCFQCFGWSAVVIPVGVVELHEPHAAFDQPPGQQAVAGVRRLAWDP